MLSTLTKWSSYLERLDEEFIERSGTWSNVHCEFVILMVCDTLEIKHILY